MKVTATLPYFGCKRTLAPTIVEEFGPHSAYWEPFCGSMAVLLAKEPCGMETVNDLHGDAINLARVIQDRELGPMLYRELRRTLAVKALMDEAAARWKRRGNVPATNDPDIDRAYDYFVSSWLGRNGVSGTESFNQGYARRFTKNGGHAAKRWTSAVDSIPTFRRRLRCVSILNECAFGLIERIEDAIGVVIFIDAPYIVKGARYVHDFEPLGVTPADREANEERVNTHERLAMLLRRFKRTRIVVTYYDHPALKELYPGWTTRKIEVVKALQNQTVGVREKKKATEVLLINGPSFASCSGLFSEATA